MITAGERIDELLTRTYTPDHYNIDINAPAGRAEFDDAINANVESILEDIADYNQNPHGVGPSVSRAYAIELAFQSTTVANANPLSDWPLEYLKRTAADASLTNDFLLHETLNLIEPLLETSPRRRLFRRVMAQIGHYDSRGLTYLIVDLYIELWNAARKIERNRE